MNKQLDVQVAMMLLSRCKFRPLTALEQKLLPEMHDGSMICDDALDTSGRPSEFAVVMDPFYGEVHFIFTADPEYANYSEGKTFYLTADKPKK